MADSNRFGRYLLFDKIGAGGMASVHLARLLGPVGFSRTVAVKRLRSELVTDRDFVSMFVDEARLAARIQHPNVVQVLDVISVQGEILVVMEYIRGESLARLLRPRSGPRVPLPVVLAVAIDMLYGLHAAHEATAESGERLHIVHRDVSPQNVLVGADGIARVTDFGVAKAAHRSMSTRDGEIKGKISYMAPEQVQRRRLDRRTDVFAASAVLWELLTGDMLFGADDPAATLHRILYEPMMPPSERAPAVSEELDAIVMKGLSRDPDGRFATAHAMASALEALGPARPTEVASWVDSKVGDELRALAERVRDVEKLSAEAGTIGEPTTSASSAAGPRLADMATAPVVVGAPVVPSIDAPVRRAPARRAALAALGVAALVGVGVSMRAWPPAAARATVSSVAFVSGTIDAAAPVASSGPAPRATVAAPRTVPIAPKAGPVRKPEGDCNPPYTIDARGIRIYKRHCLEN